MSENKTCLWCDASFPARENALHPQICLDCCGGVDMLTHCGDNPKHAIPTVGPKCFECEHEAEVRARRVARNAPFLAQLREIRAQHVRDFNKAWPGMNFGKAHFGMMLDGAISALEEKS
jgi:hypothetical protein